MAGHFGIEKKDEGGCPHCGSFMMVNENGQHKCVSCGEVVEKVQTTGGTKAGTDCPGIIRSLNGYC